jgi:hypothetical protein
VTIGTAEEAVPPRRARARLARQTKVDYWLDAALVVAFTLDYSFRFTGLTVHEWIGLGLGAALLAHLTFHWDWVLRTTRRLFRRLPGREQVRWLIDLALLVVMTLCVASGVLISRSALPAVGIHPPEGPFWTGLHTTSADVTVALVSAHAALSWRWVVSVSRRMFRRSRIRSAG